MAPAPGTSPARVKPSLRPYIREAATVRETLGICDVSSLGKIAVQGPDASEFLNRIYSNAFAKLAVGKARYGIMLRDDGMVMDDGTTWRLTENDFSTDHHHHRRRQGHGLAGGAVAAALA